EKHLTVQIAKIIKNKEERATIDEFLATWKQKHEDYIKLTSEVKRNEELIKQQQDKLKKSQIAITENKKLIEQRMKEEEEIQKTLASDNHELERQLNEVYEIKKDMVPRIYNFDFDFDKLINPTPVNSVPNSPTVKPLTIDTTLANSAVVKPIINNFTPVNSVPNSPAPDKIREIKSVN
ncbi:hypothetical protein ACJMK2_020294, partial [Sinanodonta woodiana]